MFFFLFLCFNNNFPHIRTQYWTSVQFIFIVLYSFFSFWNFILIIMNCWMFYHMSSILEVISYARCFCYWICVFLVYVHFNHEPPSWNNTQQFNHFKGILQTKNEFINVIHRIGLSNLSTWSHISLTDFIL